MYVCIIVNKRNLKCYARCLYQPTGVVYAYDSIKDALELNLLWYFAHPMNMWSFMRKSSKIYEHNMRRIIEKKSS